MFKILQLLCLNVATVIKFNNMTMIAILNCHSVILVLVQLHKDTKSAVVNIKGLVEISSIIDPKKRLGKKSKCQVGC